MFFFQGSGDPAFFNFAGSLPGSLQKKILGSLLGSLPKKFFLGSLPEKIFGIPGGIRGIKKISVRIFDFVNKFT